MGYHQSQLRITILSILAVLGVIYSGLISSRQTLTGLNSLDGLIGVVFGLFICSRPAANLVDLFFYRRSFPYPFSSGRPVVLWIALNTLVLLIGGIVIFMGTTRFIGKTV